MSQCLEFGMGHGEVLLDLISPVINLTCDMGTFH